MNYAKNYKILGLGILFFSVRTIGGMEKPAITHIEAYLAAQAAEEKKLVDELNNLPNKDMQVRAGTAIARLGRMRFKIPAEQIDGERMLNLLRSFGLKENVLYQEKRMKQMIAENEPVKKEIVVSTQPIKKENVLSQKEAVKKIITVNEPEKEGIPIIDQPIEQEKNSPQQEPINQIVAENKPEEKEIEVIAQPVEKDNDLSEKQVKTEKQEEMVKVLPDFKTLKAHVDDLIKNLASTSMELSEQDYVYKTNAILDAIVQIIAITESDVTALQKQNMITYYKNRFRDAFVTHYKNVIGGDNLIGIAGYIDYFDSVLDGIALKWIDQQEPRIVKRANHTNE